ncbi:hypothetical protein [Yinghuangia sp. YIM S09857]|uniref:hypothetical protein n=1 Tax=Yinghuangia sp. YIM S09857 TaxID=3436929 RepID=UPI003F538053
MTNGGVTNGDSIDHGLTRRQVPRPAGPVRRGARRRLARRTPAALLAVAALGTTLAGCADARVARQVVDSAADPAGPLGDDKLRDVVLAGEDIPGGMTGPTAAPAAAYVESRDEDCDPLARLLSGGVGSADARAHTAASWSVPGSTARTTVVITSFAETGAQRVVDEGLRALDWCYTLARPTAGPGTGSDAAWTEHQPQCVPVPEAGDLSVGLQLSASTASGEDAAPTGYVIVRIEDVLAVFAQSDPTHNTSGMPNPDVVTAQIERIRDALD